MPDATEPTVTASTFPTVDDLIAIYESIPGNTAYITDLLIALRAISARDANEDASVESLSDDIATLSALILANTREILYLHSLVGRLVLELIEQGIEIESKKLLQELELYGKSA